MALSTNQKFTMFHERRNELVALVKQKYEESRGFIILFANFERDGHVFKQDTSFFYYTGLQEPAAVLCIEVETGKSTLFVPNFGKVRAKWVADAIEANAQKAQEFQVDSIEYLGDQCAGYQGNPYFRRDEYKHFLKLIEESIAQGQKIYTLNPSHPSEYFEQRFILHRIAEMVPTFKQAVSDISSLVAQMRRKKSKFEIEQMYKAIEITIDAQEAAMQLMKPGKRENEIQALIEYHYTISGATAAFSSIVASGKNSTILHYMENNRTLVSGDLVVVDIGARYNSYCADITRTYPVSGKFSQRQKEVYDLVLQTQTYIANLAKPGMWLSNKDKPEQSLNHLAKKFIEDYGYGEYCIHGIGHFLGLDVHDVGDHAQPLQVGDVITIEPGIYIADESIGIRIEDDYWIVPDGSLCLSENLLKEAKEVEKALAYAVEEVEN